MSEDSPLKTVSPSGVIRVILRFIRFMPKPVLPVKVLDLHLHLGKSQRTGDRHTEAVLQCRGEKRLFQGNRAIMTLQLSQFVVDTNSGKLALLA